MRISIAGCIATTLTVLFAHAAAGQSPSHIEVRGPYQKGLVTNAAIDGRLTGAAEQYADVPNIPRIAMFDVAYPADANELKRLHGHALVVLTAVARDSTELPLGRIYIRNGSATTRLEPAVRLMSRVHDQRIGRVFGTFREDVIVLMPLQARRAGAELTVDFAAHRKVSASPYSTMTCPLWSRPFGACRRRRAHLRSPKFRNYSRESMLTWRLR